MARRAPRGQAFWQVGCHLLLSSRDLLAVLPETYIPASSLGWLDFDAAAGDRVTALLRALTEPGTLDPLGLGSVRDGFAALFHPGTSTIQTRLRYFVFLLWTFHDLESRRVPPSEFFAALKDREVRLIECLRHLGANQGVIGYSAGRDLKRFPSAVYWGGMGSWGIRRLDLSLAEYAKYAATIGRAQAERDDDGNVTARPAGMWISPPPAPEGFLDRELTFRLEPEEARLLAEGIEARHPASLLAALCGAPEVAAAAGHPWDLPEAVIPDHLADLLRHARCFSELTVGPQLVYNLALARRAKRELSWDSEWLVEDQLASLGRWARLVSSAERHDELTTWVGELDRCWKLLPVPEAVGEPTRTFIATLTRRAVQDPSSFSEDPLVQEQIRRREVQLKGKRARLGPRAALEAWNGQPFGGQLTYRWPTAQGYLADIAEALSGGS